jgi:hypothetical protein
LKTGNAVINVKYPEAVSRLDQRVRKEAGMKITTTVIAFAAVMVSTQAMAFWGWSDSNEQSQGRSRGTGDMSGTGTGEAEATFGLDFKFRGKGDGDFKGKADSNNDWRGYSYDTPYYWYGAPSYYGPYGMPYTPQSQPPASAPQQ